MKPLNQITPADILDFIKKVDKKTWIVVAVTVAVAVLLFVFIISPAWFERLQVRSKVKNLQAQKVTTQNLLRKEPDLLKNKENFHKFSLEVKQRLHQPGEGSLLLGVISKLAQESKISIVASNPRKFDEKFPAPFDVQYEANAYDFTVEGGFHDLGLFISKIETHSKVLRIQSFLIRPQEKSPEKHLAEISLTVVSVKQPPGA